MKKLFAILLILTFIMSGLSAFACSPPHPNTPSYALQSPRLAKLFDDNTVLEQKIVELGGLKARLVSLAISDGNHLVTITNGCSITLREKWERPGGGMCPIFHGHEVISTSCP